MLLKRADDAEIRAKNKSKQHAPRVSAFALSGGLVNHACAARLTGRGHRPSGSRGQFSRDLWLQLSHFEDTFLGMESPVSAKAALLQAMIAGPGYGLDLIERVAKHTKGAVQLGQGSVYPALRDLEHDGLLESYEGEPLPERGGRPRRYYKLTALGAKAAMEQRDVVFGLFGVPEAAR